MLLLALSDPHPSELSRLWLLPKNLNLLLSAEKGLFLLGSLYSCRLVVLTGGSGALPLLEGSSTLKGVLDEARLVCMVLVASMTISGMESSSLGSSLMASSASTVLHLESALVASDEDVSGGGLKGRGGGVSLMPVRKKGGGVVGVALEGEVLAQIGVLNGEARLFAGDDGCCCFWRGVVGGVAKGEGCLCQDNGADGEGALTLLLEEGGAIGGLLLGLTSESGDRIIGAAA